MEALERDLVAKARAGDRNAFKQLAERYYRRVYNTLYAMTKDEEKAMDLTQETFAKALTGIKDFNMTSSFYTWLYRIATNTAIDMIRKKGVSKSSDEYDDRVGYEKLEGQLISHKIKDPLKAVEDEEMLQIVRECLDKVRPEFREILVLREVEGMSYEEIADVLGIKVGTVMSRLFNARMMLRGLLEAKMLRGLDKKGRVCRKPRHSRARSLVWRCICLKRRDYLLQ